MPVDLVSLAVIALVAAACPIAARLVPNRLVPETVFLLIAGALLGPYLGGIIDITDSVGLLSDLGLAFLFLLAGYEINPKSLTGSQGRRGLATWAASFALAFAALGLLAVLFPRFSVNHFEYVSMAIVLTTTALGTLMPILKERGLTGTRVGESILAYGTWGELCPVLAMAVLLSTRAEWKTVLILLAFIALCVIVAVVPAKAKKAGHRLYRFLSENADTTSQTMMRVTVLLLVGLITFSAVFDLDIVLGAFAAGFVLRYVIPEGNDSLECKLDGVAYGFLIPVFFVVSGAKIDLLAVFEQPLLLIGFIAALLLIRAVPILVALATGKDTRDLSIHSRLTIALYCTTALPVIVAVTSVAVSAGAMSQGLASVLVAAGAITVFLMPLLASLTYRVADVQPIECAREITQNPRNARAIIREHIELERMLARQAALERLAQRHEAAPDTAEGDSSWRLRASDLQRTSARKRAIDEALDVAAQEIAAKRAALGEGVSKGAAGAKAKAAGAAAAARASAEAGGAPAQRMRTGHAHHREDRMRRLAERAVREQMRRQAELSHTLRMAGFEEREIGSACHGRGGRKPDAGGISGRGNEGHAPGSAAPGDAAKGSGKDV